MPRLVIIRKDALAKTMSCTGEPPRSLLVEGIVYTHQGSDFPSGDAVYRAARPEKPASRKLSTATIELD